MNINKLLSSMTLEEKIGQMIQLPPRNFIIDSDTDVIGNEYDLGLDLDQIYTTGSILGIGSATEMKEIQTKYLESSRLKIPLIFMADIVHGYETIFPIPLALSCSWNEKLAFDTARISAVEAATSGIHVTFAPMADLSRDPRWGRVLEGFGEDTYLLSRFTESMVKGFQQNDVSLKGNIASCVKHFVGYGAPIAGRDYNTVDMSKLSLYQDYIGGYKSAIEAGAKLVMSSFNTFDGIPVTVNENLMVEVLREKLGFEGVTITDFDGLNQVIAHRVAENQREAAVLGVKAKIDIEMASTCYIDNIVQLISDQRISIKEIDEAVMRILRLKSQLGLFSNPFSFANEEDEKLLVRSSNHLENAKEIASECAVLLKNEKQILPLKEGLKIALIGPFATETKTNGAWSWRGNNYKNVTLFEALTTNGYNVDIIDYLNEQIEDQLSKVDVVICALGEHQDDSGEAKSKVNLELPDRQVKWIDFAKKSNKKVITVLYNGRPLVLNNIDNSDAILEAWFLGSKTNETIVDILTGKINPSGKLTMSFPRHVGQIPVYYNQLTTGRPRLDQSNPYTSFYLDCGNTPKYSFGFGLSYSNFIYGNILINKKYMTKKDTIQVSIDVKNTSSIGGYEIVQLYIRDEVSIIARPEKELKRYKKIWIDPNITETIQFTLSVKDLYYKNPKDESKIESGVFTILIGPNSTNLHSTKINFQ